MTAEVLAIIGAVAAGSVAAFGSYVVKKLELKSDNANKRAEAATKDAEALTKRENITDSILNRYEKVIADMSATILAKDKTIIDKDVTIAHLTANITARDEAEKLYLKQIKALEKKVDELVNQIKSMELRLPPERHEEDLHFGNVG